MDIQEIVDLFNPANAKALTPEQIQLLETISDEALAALAKAYPNQAKGIRPIKIPVPPLITNDWSPFTFQLNPILGEKLALPSHLLLSWEKDVWEYVGEVERYSLIELIPGSAAGWSATAE